MQILQPLLSQPIPYLTPPARLQPSLQPVLAIPSRDTHSLSQAPAGLLPAASFNLVPPARIAQALNPGPAIGSVTLDLLTLNTYGLPKPIGKNIAERSRRIGPALAGFDIVGLQETFSAETGEIHKSAQQAGLHFNAFRPKDRRLSNSGLTNLSKFPIVAREFAPFRYSSHADALAKKGVAFTRLDVPGIGFVDVYNSHFQAAGDRPQSKFKAFLSKMAGWVLPGFDMPKEAIRQHDIQVMADLIRKQDRGYPTFILGDLNLSESRPIYQELLSQLGAQDSFRLVNPHDPGYTSDGLLNPIKDGEGRSRIDYILFRSGPGFKIEVLSSQLAFNQAIAGQFVSDHFGVHSRVKISRLAVPIA